MYTLIQKVTRLCLIKKISYDDKQIDKFDENCISRTIKIEQ